MSHGEVRSASVSGVTSYSPQWTRLFCYSWAPKPELLVASSLRPARSQPQILPLRNNLLSPSGSGCGGGRERAKASPVPKVGLLLRWSLTSMSCLAPRPLLCCKLLCYLGRRLGHWGFLVDVAVELTVDRTPPSVAALVKLIHREATGYQPLTWRNHGTCGRSRRRLGLLVV